MKKTLAVVLLFQFFFFQAMSQTPAVQLVKNTWTALLTKYGPVAHKEGIGVFDPDGKRTEWPIWVRDISDTSFLSKEWVDGLEYHFNVSYFVSMRNLFRLATRFPKTRITNFEDAPMIAEEKESFTQALVERFGSTKNVYAVTNEGQNPVEFMTAFFVVKGSTAKFIGYFAHPYVE